MSICGSDVMCVRVCIYSVYLEMVLMEFPACLLAVGSLGYSK